jgi:hypothetical protein
MDPKYNWLVSRIAHQQEIRYKGLLENRVKHSQAIVGGSCSASQHCLGGSAMALRAFVIDLSNGDWPEEGGITDETFPRDLPMPSVWNFPAEFECQFCFKAKKLQEPSDWTKHFHEDMHQFTCTYEICKEPKSLKRKADWIWHENERYRHFEWWIC